MECRFVPVRVRDTENALDYGRDGPVHAQDHRVWHARRNRRWNVVVPDVPAGDWQATASEIPQFG